MVGLAPVVQATTVQSAHSRQSGILATVESTSDQLTRLRRTIPSERRETKVAAAVPVVAVDPAVLEVAEAAVEAFDRAIAESVPPAAKVCD